MKRAFFVTTAVLLCVSVLSLVTLAYDTADLPGTEKTDIGAISTAEDSVASPPAVPEEEQDGFVYKIDFQHIDTQLKFESPGKNAAVKFMTENELAYTRFTALAPMASVVSSGLLQVNSGSCRYIAIEYRASARTSSQFAFSFSSDVYAAPSYENAIVLPDIARDGMWHTVVIDMVRCEGWSGNISDLAFYFYSDSDMSAGETFDISFAKFYIQRPSFENEYNSIIYDDIPDSTDGDGTGAAPTESGNAGEQPPGGKESDFPVRTVLIAAGVFLAVGIAVAVLARRGKEHVVNIAESEEVKTHDEDREREDAKNDTPENGAGE